MMESFAEIEAALKSAPATWIPALLRALVERSKQSGVFVEGGLVRFVTNAEQQAPK